jgi:hypothetical protein
MAFLSSWFSPSGKGRRAAAELDAARALLSFMVLTFRQRKTSSSGTGCCTSIKWPCSVSYFSPAGKGRRVAAELDAARALLSFMVLTCRQRKTSSSGTGYCMSIAQFHDYHLQAKEDEQQRNWMLHEDEPLILRNMEKLCLTLKNANEEIRCAGSWRRGGGGRAGHACKEH